MKNILKNVGCLFVIVAILCAFTGCDVPVGNVHGAAYFADVDEMIKYFNPSDTSVYEAIRKPDDERFIDCGYLCYNINNPGTRNVKIRNDYVLAFYKVDINGENVYIVFYSYIHFPKTFNIVDNDMRYAERMREFDVPTKVLIPEEYEPSVVFMPNCVANRVIFDKGDYAVKGFVKEITDGKVFSDEEFRKDSSWFAFRSIYATYMTEAWAIYDTRSVPQTEKDALALELMEILYNNYKLAGEMAE